MSDSEEIVLKETVGRVGLVRINRPKQLNALNGDVIATIVRYMSEFDEDDGVGAMVLTGNEKAFAAGADIKEMANATPVDHMLGGRIAMWQKLREIKKPMIAAVSGWCLGGGNELAMSCDIMVASEKAKFGQPEINVGIMPGAGGTQRLTEIVGKSLAMEMCLNSRFLSAEEALHFGLVSHVYPVDSYLDDAVALAEQIANRAPIAIRLIKEAVNHAYESFLSDGLKDERNNFYLLFSTEDQKEGMQAFIEKRDPNWQGK